MVVVLAAHSHVQSRQAAPYSAICACIKARGLKHDMLFKLNFSNVLKTSASLHERTLVKGNKYRDHPLLGVHALLTSLTVVARSAL